MKKTLIFQIHFHVYYLISFDKIKTLQIQWIQIFDRDIKTVYFFFYSNSKLTKAVTNVKKTSTQKVIETCNTANSTVVVQKAY